MSAIPLPDPGTFGACYDCGRRYGDEYGFPDLVVPDDVWAKISPRGDEGGLLCPSCICRRCHALGISCTATFRSGPFCDNREMTWQKMAEMGMRGQPQPKYRRRS